MDIIYNVELLFYCLLATVHVSSRSRMTAHSMEPHPAREWIQMTPMDIVNVEFCLFFYCFATHCIHVSSRSRMMADMEPPSQGIDPDDTNGHR
eukprot:scaffold35698_cov63-Attheya_sp.AAC.18